jgi:regulator of protease activity HflC (stomatin/prohibitin superfamily)
MTTTVNDYTQAAQEQTLKAIRQAQQAVVEAVRTSAKTAEKTIPETPALPFADKLPTPQEIVQMSFGFAEELLKAQREFAENLLTAATPVLKKTGKTNGTKAS